MARARQIEVESFVDNGRLTKNREDITDAISQFEGKPVTISIKRYFKKRSVNQNSYYHGVIVEHWRNLIREEWGDIMTHDQVHEFLKTNLSFENIVDAETGEIMVNSVTGDPLRKIKSTTKNVTFDQEEYHEACRQLAYEMFGAHIPLPEKPITAKFT